jgi:hypothetical protein
VHRQRDRQQLSSLQLHRWVRTWLVRWHGQLFAFVSTWLCESRVRAYNWTVHRRLFARVCRTADVRSALLEWMPGDEFVAVDLYG